VILQEPKIDSHCHVIDPARFPYAADTPYRPAGHEIAPLDSLLRTMDLHDVRHALIVATNSAYGEDLSPVLDALARGEGRFRGVAVVARDIETAALARLRKAGFVGIAFNSAFFGTDYYATTGDLLRKLADLDLFLQIQARDAQFLAFLDLIAHADVRVIVDHCGRPDPAIGLDQPGFQALLALGRAGRAHVKISGFSQFSRQRHPYADIEPYVAALLAAFTPAACVWGSDWPWLRAPERIDYAPLLQRLETMVPDAADRRAVLWDTPRRLFGFGA